MKICPLILAVSTLLLTSVSSAEDSYHDDETITYKKTFKVEIEEEFEPYWELLLLGGTAALDQADTTFKLYDYLPADKLKQHNEGTWEAWTVQAGFGYAMPLYDSAERYSDELQWFPVIQPQINAYYLEGDMEGVDDRFFEFPGAAVDTDYSMNLQSTRLMFDLALTVMSWKNLSIYGIAGIGPSWNRIGYHGKEVPDCIQELNLDKHTDTNFAYEFGGGLNYSLTQHLSLTAEYLYVGLNDIELASSGKFDGEDISDVDSDSFNIRSQTVLLGFRLAF